MEYKSKKCFCEAWTLTELEPARDFNIALALDDERGFDYVVNAVSWVEPTPVPATFRVGVGPDGKIDKTGSVCQFDGSGRGCKRRKIVDLIVYRLG